MKKIIFGCMALLSTASLGASVDALANSTPAYLGNPAQNATLTPEAAFYNPAGLIHLEDGNYLSLGGQIADTTFKMETEDKRYRGKDPSGFVPNVSYIHKKGDFAFYGNIGAAGGGAELDYKNGVPLLDYLLTNPLTGKVTGEGSIKGKNAYIMGNLGTSYKINNQWSVSAALRYIYAQRDIKITAPEGSEFWGAFREVGIIKADGVYDSKREATGFGGVFGLSYKPNDKLNLGLTYATRVNLKFKAKASGTDSGLGTAIGIINKADPKNALAPISDGDKRRRDLPAELKGGLAYKVNEKWTVMTGGNYHFLTDAETDEKGGFKNGWELNLGTEYKLTEKWTLTAGYNYAETGAEDRTLSDTEIALDSHIFSLGAKYQQTPNLSWTLSTMLVNYIDNHANNDVIGKEVEYRKRILALGLGATYKF